MTLHLYNSRTRALERFEPLDAGVVRMYTCGPTVYDRAHIGNFRTFLWEDLLRRYLKASGYRVTQVMNLTDVDDRTIDAATRKGLALDRITDPVIEMFFEDWDTLGLERVEHTPRATEHVDAMIELIRRLEARGLTYQSDGSVYFAIARFPAYGALVNLDPDAVREAGRASGDEEYDKDDPRDFVLWKGGLREAEGGVATWESEWGVGRPGWHLECSAMAMQYLGETLDIHTGGVDNIFPHHTNEIAQSEGATGQPFARFWLHAAHLVVDGGKMSKSLGNVYTIPELRDRGHAPSSIRYLMLSGHYRSQLNFTFEGLDTATRSVARLAEFDARLDQLSETSAADRPVAPDVDLSPLASRATEDFRQAMDDDLNVSEALAAVFNLVRDANSALDRAAPASPRGVPETREFLALFDRVFGVLALKRRETGGIDPELGDWVADMIERRREARTKRDFARADQIRNEIEARGVVLEDTPEGTRWKLKQSATTADSVT